MTFPLLTSALPSNSIGCVNSKRLACPDNGTHIVNGSFPICSVVAPCSDVTVPAGMVTGMESEHVFPLALTSNPVILVTLFVVSKK
jgi:hypothetical protein